MMQVDNYNAGAKDSRSNPRAAPTAFASRARACAPVITVMQCFACTLNLTLGPPPSCLAVPCLLISC